MEDNKFFVVDYHEGFDKPMKTRFYRHDDQMHECQLFCARVKENGGMVNIRIRNVEASY